MDAFTTKMCDFVMCCSSRSTQCSACFVGRQKTPSVCCQTIPDSLPLSSRPAAQQAYSQDKPAASHLKKAVQVSYHRPHCIGYSRMQKFRHPSEAA